MKNTLRFGALLLFAFVMLTALLAPVQPAYANSSDRPTSLSSGCLGWNIPADMPAEALILSRAGGWFDAQYSAGEQITAVLSQVPGFDYHDTTFYMEVNGQPVASTGVPGVASYTIPADGFYNLSIYSGNGVPASFVGSTCGMPTAEPYIETVVPALGVDLDKARESAYNGQLPLDVFEAKWWGIKTVTENKFPALADMDLTGVEVRCLNGAGEWVDDYVTVSHSDAGILQVLVKQHGICGIFPQ